MNDDTSTPDTESNNDPAEGAREAAEIKQSPSPRPSQRSARRDDDRHDRPPASTSLAIGLGCFSLALGLAELAVPRVVARAIGAPPDARTCRALRGFGLREVASGMAILAQPDRAAWLWSRVGGDVLDISSLGAVRCEGRSGRGRRVAATIALLGVTVLDIVGAVQVDRRDPTISDVEGGDTPDTHGRTIFRNTPLAT